MVDPHAMTDKECSLWYCEECSESGAIYVLGADVYSVVLELEDAHNHKSPDCKAVVGRLRIARPDSWYRDTITALAQAAQPRGA